MAQNIPPALEAELQKFDTMRRNHEALTNMTQALQTEMNEVTGTIQELKKQADDTVTYKAVGQVMFKVDKPTLTADLDDRQKTLEMRQAATKKQLDGLTEKLQELQNKIQMDLSKQNLRLQ